MDIGKEEPPIQVTPVMKSDLRRDLEQLALVDDALEMARERLHVIRRIESETHKGAAEYEAIVRHAAVAQAAATVAMAFAVRGATPER